MEPTTGGSFTAKTVTRTVSDTEARTGFEAVITISETPLAFSNGNRCNIPSLISNPITASDNSAENSRGPSISKKMSLRFTSQYSWKSS